MVDGMELSPHTSQDISKKYKLLFLVFLFLPCLFVINNALDNDIWFLLNSGRYVFAHGIPYTEPFTIHQGFDFVMQQWLSACIFWIVYCGLGIAGLKALIIVCYGIIVFLIYRISMKVSGDHFFVSLFVSLVASFVILPIITARPGIFSTLILVIELYFLEMYMLTSKRKYLFSLPLLSLLCINIHAAMWPMLFVLMLPYLVESFHFKIGKYENSGNPKMGLFCFATLMLVAGCVNPYGLKAMAYLFRSYGYKEINGIVSEMQPPELNSFLGPFIYGGLLVLLFGYLFYRKGTTRPRYLLLTVGTLYLALSAIRSIPLFAISGFFPLAYYLREIKLPEFQEVALTKRTLRLRQILIGLILVLLILVFCLLGLNVGKGSQDVKLLTETIQYIQNERTSESVVLYTGYNEGDLAEYMGIPAYLDTRAEVFVKKNNHKSDVMKEYYDLQKGELYYKDFLEKYHFTHLLVTKSDILYIELLHDQNYRLTYSNKKYFLFEKDI